MLCQCLLIITHQELLNMSHLCTEGCLGRWGRIHCCKHNTMRSGKHCLYSPGSICCQAHICALTGQLVYVPCPNLSFSYTLTKNRHVHFLYGGKQKEPA